MSRASGPSFLKLAPLHRDGGSRLFSAPLVETIGGTYAAKLRAASQLLPPRVDARTCGAALGGPAVHKQPERRHEMPPPFVLGADNEMIVQRRDVD